MSAQPTPVKPRRHRRWPWIALASVVSVLVGARLLLNPLASWEARRQLAKLEGYRTDFSDLTIRLWKLEVDLADAKVIKQSAGGEKEPFFEVEHLRLGVHGRQLLHGNVVARVSLDHPKLTLIAAKEKSKQQLAPETPHLDKVLASMVPLEMEQLETRDGEVLFIDKSNADFPKLWLHQLDLTVENLATRPSLVQKQPTTLAAAALLQDHGKLSVFLTADPLRKGLYFAGQAQLTNFPVSELAPIMVSETGLRLEKGTLDAFAEIRCEDGKLTGGVKPVLKNAKVGPGKRGDPVNELEAALADTGVKLLSDRVKGRNAVAAVIPLSGRVDNPDAQLWPTVLGVLRNAFVLAVTEGYSQLPPPKAQARQGPVQQAVEALDRGKSAPKQQPEENKK